ncbi:urease accessory protein [Roseateles toxinivorans]|uniref:Urease accessory protein UreD n=1 Tax=Roseateles toxinivorans TaxID=270368 RepID=A0A4R6QMA1_9BURK|nr:urease accessory protein UreD [Roseateles toxinivorans]TDP71055.1 urease accessory protein [Roseateles toxinivorans]
MIDAPRTQAAWAAHLQLTYRAEAERTLAHDLHSGPLRVLQALYPEGPGICHHVLVHPPGGVVGGDELRVTVEAGAGSRALITTPGATRFYRSAGPWAEQRTELHLAAGAMLEWLPLETLAYDQCLARNTLSMQLEPGSLLMGWDLLALGLPAAERPFAQGEFATRIHWPGVWLEQSLLRADDVQLRQSPLGLAGRSCVGTMWLASGTALDRALLEQLLDEAREEIGQAGADITAGVSSTDPRLLVLRLLASHTETAFALLRAVRARWRPLALGLPAHEPRIWRQ